MFPFGPQRPGYYKDEEAFLKRVEEDAVNFKPFGKLIYSYTRPAPATAAKGKEAVDSKIPESSISDDMIEFEVYHVRDFR